MENIKPQESDRQILDTIAMDFQSLAEGFQQKSAGENVYTLTRIMMITLQRLRDSQTNEFVTIKNYIKQERQSINSLIERAKSFSTESELESITKELHQLNTNIQHKGLLEDFSRD
jgi:hypothetical protein